MKRKRKKKLIIWGVILLALAILYLKECVYYNLDDYKYGSFSYISEDLRNENLTIEEINAFQLLSYEDLGDEYHFRWYQITDTQDSVFFTAQVNKKWPYAAGMSYSGNLEQLGQRGPKGLSRYPRRTPWKYRLKPGTLFDTTVVTKANMSNYVHLRTPQNDSLQWIVDHEKIVQYLRKGYYDILWNREEPYVIEFFNQVMNYSHRFWKTSWATVYSRPDGGIELGIEPDVLKELDKKVEAEFGYDFIIRNADKIDTLKISYERIPSTDVHRWRAEP